MKTMSVELKTHYQGKILTIARCWKVIRSDGVIEGYTSHVKDIPFDSVIYAASTGYTSTNIHSNSDLSVDNLDVYGVLDSAGISSADLSAGVYDFATVEIFEVNYQDLSQGRVILQTGRLGEVKINDNIFIAEMRSLSQLLQQTIGEVITPTCRADLGDSRCGIILEPADWIASTVYTLGDIIKPTVYDARRYICTTAGTSGGAEPTWDTTIGNTTSDGTVVWTAYDAYIHSGIVVSASSRKHFIDISIGKATDYFNGGLLTWTSGSNSGYSMEVKSFVKSMSFYNFYLFQTMPNDIQVGDTFKVTVGCDKIVPTCKEFSPENGTRGNIYNFRGEPFLPGNDQISKFGGQ